MVLQTISGVYVSMFVCVSGGMMGSDGGGEVGAGEGGGREQKYSTNNKSCNSNIPYQKISVYEVLIFLTWKMCILETQAISILRS